MIPCSSETRDSVRRVGWPTWLAFIVLGYFSTPSFAQPTTTIYNGNPVVAGEILIRLRGADNAIGRLQGMASSANVRVAAEVEALSTRMAVYRVRMPGVAMAELMQMFARNPDVVYAEPNYIVQAVATPNDTYYSLLYGMARIGAPAAWDVTTGGTSAVIGVVDTGIDYTHPDLAANIWSAPAAFSVTIGGATISCPAGSHGFNAITRSCDPDDDHYHGTHVSGTIGGEGNNGSGVAGVNWRARIMGLKFLGASGTGTTADAVSAIEFAVQVKQIFAGTATPVNLRVLSNSWSGGGYSQALLDVINTANTSGMLFVVAAGNSSIDNAAYSVYPANYTAPNVITVAATDSADALASFSSFGSTTVHLGAPGVNTYSTSLSGDYTYASGTSMATPHVAGAALLALSMCPSLTTADLKRLVLNSTDAVPALATNTITGGRLNVAKMVQGCRAGSVAPASGLGSAQTFAFRASDPDGASDIAHMQVLFNASSNTGDGCYLQFARASNQVWLWDSASSQWLGPATLGTGGTLAGSRCAIDALRSFSSSSGNILTLNVAMSFLAGFGGAKTTFLNMDDSGGSSTGWQVVGNWTVPGATNQPSNSPLLQPASGLGEGRLFSYSVSDPDGGNDVASVQILMNNGLSATNGCWIYFVPGSKLLYLRDAGSTSWLGPVTLGISEPLSNGLCTVYPGASSSWSSGNTLTVNVSLIFAGGFAGAKRHYLLATDSSGQSTNWQDVGGWQVQVANFYPYPVSVNPSNGSGRSQTFALVVSDGNGATDIVSAGFLINNTSSLTNACYILFSRSSNELYLLNDSASGYFGPVVVGSAGSLSNSQCTVNAAGSSSSLSGNNLAVNLALTFSSSFTGSKAQYAQATDTTGATSGLYYLGIWFVPGAQVPPVAEWVSPSFGSGAGQTFTYVVSDANGPTDIASMQILVNNGLSGSFGCWMYFVRTSNQIWLRDDGNASWSGPVTLGSTGTLSNSQCTLNAANSYTSTAGNSLYVTAALTFRASFAGVKTHFLYAADAAGADTGWRALGTYTVLSSTPPEALWITPSAGSGTATTLYYSFYDPNGAADISSMQILIASTLNPVNACYAYIAGTTLYLAANSGTAWSSPVTLGSPGTVQNSQCAIDAGSSYVSSSGNYLTVSLRFTFAPAFAGSKSNFMFATDSTGLSSGWQSRGTWTVP